MRKFYRLYYNRQCSLPWSIDEGTQETEKNYARVYLKNVVLSTRTNFNEMDRENKPVVWLEGYGVLEIVKASDGTEIARLQG